MRKSSFLTILMVAMMMVFSNLVFADNTTVSGQNTGTFIQTTTANPTATATVSDVKATATGGAVTDSGNGTAIIKEAQQLPQVLTPTTNFYFVAPPDSNSQHRPSQYAAKDYSQFIQRMNKARFNKMKKVLKEAHEMNSNNRVWEDMEPNMTVEATIFIEQPALTDDAFVDLLDLKDKRFNNENTIFMGSFIATDKDPVKHPISHPYMSWGVYPYAKMTGVNVLVKIDSYHFSLADANSYGAGISGNWAKILNCITGFGIGLNAGVGGSKAREDVAGGVMYLAFYVPPEPETPPCLISPPVPPPPPVVTKPKACNPDEFIWKLKNAEYEISICWLYSHNNLFWQLEAMKDSLDVYVCTHDARYLEDAIQHGQMAELNYFNGKDIASYPDSSKLIGEVEYWLASAFYAKDKSIDNYWKAPDYVTHINKKSGNAESVALTGYEKKRVEKIRSTLERYSKKLVL